MLIGSLKNPINFQLFMCLNIQLKYSTKPSSQARKMGKTSALNLHKSSPKISTFVSL
jgi:hypothetical protein